MIDESGFMLQPVVRRSWAPRGQTPIHYSWERHERLSVISGITVAPLRRRLGLYFQIYDHNIRSQEVIAFLSAVHRRLRRKFILVLDRYSVHRKAVRQLQAEHPDWLEVAWLPAYAPDLNPVELVWNRAKYRDMPTSSRRTCVICIRPSPLRSPASLPSRNLSVPSSVTQVLSYDCSFSKTKFNKCTIRQNRKFHTPPAIAGQLPAR